ncbi:nitrite/sulfite reductase [Lachnoclostridium edouardi]|uniref:nitrite/sulfite reductase n=1 Tax=Lachnoclostridium edouardi TaxID=1926283 RepID=UPI000C7C5B14|nr:nitrite/sulfite reductase [Lachnoclostridium edouardi]
MEINSYADTFREELKDFQRETEKFYLGQIDAKQYKGFSGRFGSYAQKGGKASMLRLRMAGGRLTKERLKFIADMIEEYHIDKVHLTTCQTVQLHNLNGTDVCQIMEKAIDVGILTWGGGGDFPRNVMMSPLTGVEEGEYFNVTPYGEAAAQYAMGFITKIKLPRKLKIVFSNTPANESHATFRDLGFAATPEGKFDVYSAGGLGNSPKMGVCVKKGVEPSEILYYIKAMAETFMAYGNYENRGKARTRFMQDTLGTEGYKAAFLEKLDKVYEEEKDQLKIEVSETPITKAGKGQIFADQKRVIKQKQPGLYTVVYHPIAGTPAPEKFRQLYETVKNMDQIELRIAPDQTLYIINCTAEEAEAVLKATQDGAQNEFETSVACIGSSICQVGVGDSQKLLSALVEEERTWGFEDGVLPVIHISGCPSSCGTHQIGKIGFRGGVKMVDKTPQPAFVLFVGGCDLEGQERFGKELGQILAANIPGFMKELGEKISQAGMVFEQWFPDHQKELEEIAGKYIIK